MDFKFELK